MPLIISLHFLAVYESIHLDSVSARSQFQLLLSTNIYNTKAETDELIFACGCTYVGPFDFVQDLTLIKVTKPKVLRLIKRMDYTIVCV